jgi:integrase
MHQEVQSLDDLLAFYVRERDPSAATVKGVSSVLDLFRRETGCTDIASVTHDVLNNWKTQVKSRSSEATVNTYLRSLRTLFNLACQHGMLASNPFQNIQYVREYTRLKHTAEHIDITNMLGMIRKFPEENRPEWFWEAVVKVLYYTGMRRRQLAALCWADLDFERKRILLRAESSKTRREWHVPMVDMVVPSLLHVRQKTLERLSVENVASISQSQVFNITLFHLKYSGERMTPEQLTGFFRRISKRYRVKLSPHRFRHTFATAAANQSGRNLKHLQQMLGHTSIKTTLGYVHSDTDSMREMVKGIRPI